MTIHTQDIRHFFSSAHGRLDTFLNTVVPSIGQIAFPATQNASADANTLDDYEEGTWTPVLTFATAGDLSVVYSTQVGVYSKVGRIVVAIFAIVTSTFTHTSASGDCQVTGAPFAASGSLAMPGPLGWQGITKAGYTDIIALLGSGSTTTVLRASASGLGFAAVGSGDMPTAGNVILRATLAYSV